MDPHYDETRGPRWTITAALLLFLAIAAIAGAQELPARHDGTWWREQTLDFKRAYLLGALDHAAPNMAGLGSQWIGPDTADLVNKYDSFYSLKENRGMTVAEAMPLMLAWLAAGEHVTLQDALKDFAELYQ